jgi:histidinol dehydrogenase
MCWLWQVVLVALPGVDLDAVEAEVQRQCDELPRGETARLALTHSYVIKVTCCAALVSGCFVLSKCRWHAMGFFLDRGSS